MGALLTAALLFWAVQFGFCHCKWVLLRFIPLCLVFGLFLWIEVGYTPGPDCGIRTAFEIVLIGACVTGVALGWIVYGIKTRLKKEG